MSAQPDSRLWQTRPLFQVWEHHISKEETLVTSKKLRRTPLILSCCTLESLTDQSEVQECLKVSQAARLSKIIKDLEKLMKNQARARRVQSLRLNSAQKSFVSWLRVLRTSLLMAKLKTTRVLSSTSKHGLTWKSHQVTIYSLGSSRSMN